MMEADPEGFRLEEDRAWAYEYACSKYTHQRQLAVMIQIPTIGVLNGPGFHTEMCDLTICSEDAVDFDPHFDIGSVPGDGIHSCFEELLGTKRAAYALLTGGMRGRRSSTEWKRGPAGRAAAGKGVDTRRPHHVPAAHHASPDDADHPPALETADHRRSGRRLRDPDVRSPGEEESSPQPGSYRDPVRYVCARGEIEEVARRPNYERN